MSVSLDLQNTIVLGLAAGGLACILRIGAKHWFERIEKWKWWQMLVANPKLDHLNFEAPIGCPTCMGFWSSMIVMIWAVWFSRFDRSLSWPFQLLAMTAISAWVNWQVVPVPSDLSGLSGFAGADVIVEERHDLPNNQGSFLG